MFFCVTASACMISCMIYVLVLCIAGLYSYRFTQLFADFPNLVGKPGSCEI